MFMKPIIPLDCPSLPPVHQDYVDWAKECDVSVESVIRSLLYTEGGGSIPLTKDRTGERQTAHVLPGQLWSPNLRAKACGPVDADVMIVGKAPLRIDIRDKWRMSNEPGEPGEVLCQSMHDAGVTEQEMHRYYITTILAAEPLDYGKTSIPKVWLDSQLMLFWQQLLLVKPKLCLLQGADVVKAVLGTKCNLGNTELKVTTRKFHYGHAGDDSSTVEIDFTSSISPLALIHDRGSNSFGKTHSERRLRNQLRYFHSLQSGKEQKSPLDGYTYDVVTSADELKPLLDRMRSECVDGMVAWDAEWQGDHPQSEGAYLRCIQIAWKEDHAVVIALTHPGGSPRFTRTDAEGNQTTDGAAEECARLCKESMKGLRVVGQYFMADLEWLVPFGLDLREEYDAAEKPSMVETHGGVAIELAAHALDETSLFSLDELLLAYTDWPKYSEELETYKKQAHQQALDLHKKRCTPYRNALSDLRKARKSLQKASRTARRKKWTDRRGYLNPYRYKVQQAELAVKRLETYFKLANENHAKRLYELSDGYGWMADGPLHKYAALDATAELVLGRAILKRIRNDRFGHDCRKPYWISHRATKAALEINCEGMLVDRVELDKISAVFAAKQEELIQSLRDQLQWYDFNPRSRFEFAEALFGEEFNGYWPQYGKKKRSRPPGARTLRAEPLRSTGKYPAEWAIVRAKGQQRKLAPNTSKQTIGELCHTENGIKVRRKVLKPDATGYQWVYRHEDHSHLLKTMQDFRIIDQALKSLMRPPEKSADGNYETDEDGFTEYDAGISHLMCADQRVRTRMRLTLETGRWASSSPNLQNLSSSREADYARIIGKDVNVSIKGVFRPFHAEDPAGGYEDWFFLQADYSGAELMMAATLAQDQAMLDHCKRNLLPEDHPDFYDIHSAITVKAFQLDCEPTKAGLESIGKKNLRVAGKCVAEGTPILTDRGWVPVEDLCYGLQDGESAERNDVRFVNHVTTTPQVAVYSGGVDDCLRVTASDGTELVCTPEHRLWTVGRDGDLCFSPAGNIQPGMQLIQLDRECDFGGVDVLPPLESCPTGPAHKPFGIPREASEDWAAFLGLHVAKGSVVGKSRAKDVAAELYRHWELSLSLAEDDEFAGETEHLLDRLLGSRCKCSTIRYEKHQDQRSWRLASIDFANWLAASCGRLQKDRRVPREVFGWSKPLICTFLRWLFEGDGTVKVTTSQTVVVYSTCSRQLADDVLSLLKQLGIQSSLYRESRQNYDGTYFSVRVTEESLDRFASEVGFVTGRKQSRLDARPQRTYRAHGGILHQEEHLRNVLPGLRSARQQSGQCPRAKCQECLRAKQPVKLNAARLRLIVDNVDVESLDSCGKSSYFHLRRLANMQVRWVTVRSAEAAGQCRVYDVQTTPDHSHLVVYGQGGWLTHQSVIFGSMYARSANAIAVALRQEGVFVTVEDTQQLQNALFDQYPELKKLLNACKARVDRPGWMRNVFGRYRRFPATRDETKRAAYKREASNAPIQGGVADGMNLSVRNVVDYRDQQNMRFKMNLQIHDAIYLHVPASELLQVIDPVDGVLQKCMVDYVKITPCDLNGQVLPHADPEHFGIDIDVYGHWGKMPEAHRLHRSNLPLSVGGWKEVRPGVWSHSKSKLNFLTHENRYAPAIEEK